MRDTGRPKGVAPLLNVTFPVAPGQKQSRRFHGFRAVRIEVADLENLAHSTLAAERDDLAVADDAADFEVSRE